MGREKKKKAWKGWREQEKGKSGREGNQQCRAEGKDRSEEQPCSPGGAFSKFSNPGTIKTNTSSPASRSIAQEGRCALLDECLLPQSCLRPRAGIGKVPCDSIINSQQESLLLHQKKKKELSSVWQWVR